MSKKLRIAVHTIALNEEQFAQRFMDSVKDADGVFVLDTGSTDGTVEILRTNGAKVNVGVLKPWRFDSPRNVALSMVPIDYDICVSVDLDEVLTPGWADAIRAVWTPTTTRLRYRYAWSHNPDGSPAVTFWYDKITQRRNYRWVKPVHEILTIYNQPEVLTYCEGFSLHHYPDHTKSRGSYLPLLELSTREEPEDDRNSHYLGREYMYYRRYDEAIAELKRHLSLDRARWEPERAASMRYMARCYAWKGETDESIRWSYRAIAECLGEREPWVDLGNLYFKRKDFLSAYHAMKEALKIPSRPMTYICDPEAWNEVPWDVASVSAWQLGLKEEALSLGEEALRLAPENPRLAQNVKVMKMLLESPKDK